MTESLHLALIIPQDVQSGEFLEQLHRSGLLLGLRPDSTYEAKAGLPAVNVMRLSPEASLDTSITLEAHSLGIDVITIAPDIAVHGAGLIVTDVDSTLIAQEVIEEIAHYAGTRDEVARITDRAMNGELDFAQSLRARVATLAGVPEHVFNDGSRSISVTVGAQELIAAAHANGGFFAIVSGGFEEVVAPLAASLGIDHCCANRLEVRDGFLTGRVLGDIVTADVKVNMLRRWATEHQIPLGRTVAIGDGANDIPMMHTAGMGIAFCAKPAVRDQITSQLSVPRLDVLSVLTRPVEAMA